MGMLPVNSVIRRIVEAKHDISLNSMRIVDEQIANSSTIRDEVGTNTFRRDSYT